MKKIINYSDNGELTLKVLYGYVRTLAFLYVKLGDNSGLWHRTFISGQNFKDLCGYFQYYVRKKL